MERIRWNETPVTFRSLVENSTIEKPALVQIGTKSIVVGEKINGQFIMASPCKVSNDRFDVLEQEIILSSKHTGIWRVISKNADHIHRLATADIESIYKQDLHRKRATPRSYICTKQIDAFELHVRKNDPTVLHGHRIERRRIQVDQDVEFQITDIGEVEYTPTEGERTSQDYVAAPRSNVNTLFQFLLPSMQENETLIRNRALRSIYCTTVNESYKRSFLLEVNEQPCDIYPIASEGSPELRYLHSTQNLFDYMFKYGADKQLYVKLLRGDRPIKSIEFDGYMVLKSILNGDKVPLCRVEDLEVTLVSPDLPVNVKLPTDEHAWRSSSNIRTAEFQCMQLTIALLARHESEIYVSMDVGRNPANFLQTNVRQRERITDATSRSRHHSQDSSAFEQRKKVSRDHRTQAPFHHPVSDELYRNEEKRQLKSTRERLEKETKPVHGASKGVSNRPSSSTQLSSNHKKAKAKATDANG